MESATLSEDIIKGSLPQPDAPAFAVRGRPVLHPVSLDLIVAVRNPRHASQAPQAASGARSRGARAASAAYALHDAAFPGNPEPAGADLDLEGLARSLGAEEDPRLAEPPVVEELPDGRYRLCAGERRVEAARLANWTSILCLVYPPMDPVRAHTLSLMENLHRLPMHPLEEISALCISRLLANADARGVGAEARGLLEDAWERQESSYIIIRGLEQILRDDGWMPDRPDVSWKAHLDDLGISMAPWERKRKLRLLNIQPAQQERLREVDITEAALHALGTLAPGDQAKVVDALIRNPALARKVRRIARARRDGFYDNIDDALSEVQGWRASESENSQDPTAPMHWPAQAPADLTAPVSAEIGAGEQPHLLVPSGTTEPTEPTEPTASLAATGPTQATQPQVEEQMPPEIQDAVLQLLECAERLSSAMLTLRRHRGGADLAEPWGTWSSDALEFIKRELGS
jgi:ParB-like chromosome segregation protein Spo0J